MGRVVWRVAREAGDDGHARGSPQRRRCRLEVPRDEEVGHAAGPIVPQDDLCGAEGVHANSPSGAACRGNLSRRATPEWPAGEQLWLDQS